MTFSDSTINLTLRDCNNIPHGFSWGWLSLTGISIPAKYFVTRVRQAGNPKAEVVCMHNSKKPAQLTDDADNWSLFLLHEMWSVLSGMAAWKIVLKNKQTLANAGKHEKFEKFAQPCRFEQWQTIT